MVGIVHAFPAELDAGAAVAGADQVVPALDERAGEIRAAGAGAVVGHQRVGERDRHGAEAAHVDGIAGLDAAGLRMQSNDGNGPLLSAQSADMSRVGTSPPDGEGRRKHRWMQRK